MSTAKPDEDYELRAGDVAGILVRTLELAREAGLEVKVLNSAAGPARPAGLLIFVSGLWLDAGRIVAVQPEVQHVNPGANGAANATVLSSQDAQPLGMNRP